MIFCKYTIMRMLDDRPIVLPYHAVAPWPVVIRSGSVDWVDSVYNMEDWLQTYIGPHYTAWAWSMWTLHQSDLCGVSFARERDTTLFLLKWGE